MLEYESPMTESKHRRKSPKSKDVKAVQLAVAATYEASQVYLQLAESLNNKLVEKALRSVADEERVHMDVFLKLLEEIAPGNKEVLFKKEQEVDKGM